MPVITPARKPVEGGTGKNKEEEEEKEDTRPKENIAIIIHTHQINARVS